MAGSIKSIKLEKEQILRFLPIIITSFIIIFLIFFLILPQVTRMFSLSREIGERRNALVIAEKGSANLKETKKENDELEKKAIELEKKFPRLVETTLLIDTLKDITEESKLKFASIEPLPQIDHELKGQNDFYMELPIKVRLNCNFEEAMKFIHKIENSSRLMKIREFSIKSNPQDIWEHNVEVIISTFSIGKK